MDIKQFLQQPEIQSLLAEEDLDRVYEEYNKVNPLYPYHLTKFFNKIKINPLSYMTQIPQEMYRTYPNKYITIPNNIKKIGDYAFSFAKNLETITIPDNCKTICDGAFFKCSNLKIINLPSDIRYLGSGAFCGCSSIKSFTIPDSITIIHDNLFKSCTNLKHVIIPDSITRIDGRAFSNCPNLKSITIPDSVTDIDTHQPVFPGSAFDFDIITIKCKENSYAHKYAIENDIKFELI